MAAAPEMDSLYWNQALLCGVVSRYGVTTAVQDNGSFRATFTVLVKEEGAWGRMFQQYVEVVYWGTATEAARRLRPGQAVFVEGKLTRTKRRTTKGAAEDPWYVTVQEYRIQVLDAV